VTAPTSTVRLPGLFRAMVKRKLRLESSHVQSDVMAHSTAVTSHGSRSGSESAGGGRLGYGMAGHGRTCHDVSRPKR
jgi:hypothetical protein